MKIGFSITLPEAWLQIVLSLCSVLIGFHIGSSLQRANNVSLLFIVQYSDVVEFFKMNLFTPVS